MKKLFYEKLWVLILLSICGIMPGTAQNDILAPSPEAMALIRGIQTPVNYYTGTASVNIPIYTIQSGNVSVPISLNYNTSGIKKYDMPTWVGLGWNLSAGGKITRIVRGRSDESDTGYFKQYLRFNKKWSKSEFDDFLKQRIDTEADLFYFEIPGKSGMFVFDNTGRAHCIPKQNIQIRWIRDVYDYFEITDSDGTKYIFGFDELIDSPVIEKNAIEYADSGIIYLSFGGDAFRFRLELDKDKKKDNQNYVSTWHLNKILQPNGKEINFTYDYGVEYDFYTMIYGNVFKMIEGEEYAKAETSKEKDLSYKTYVRPGYLKLIEWDGNKIEFEKSEYENREFLTNNKRTLSKLDKIRVFSSSSGMVSLFDYKLHYGYHEENRLRLDKITLEKENEEQIISSFLYHGSPGAFDRNFDHWGYHTSKNGSKYSLYNLENSELKLRGGGVDRSPDLPGSKAYSLYKITKGTGSITEFEYELHEANTVHSDWRYPGLIYNSNLYGGLRIKSVNQTEGKKTYKTNYEYIDSDSLSSGQTFSDRLFYYDKLNHYLGRDKQNKPEEYLKNVTKYMLYSFLIKNTMDITGSNVCYSQVKEILPNGSYVIRKYTSPNDHPDILAERHLVGDWDNTTGRECYFQNSSQSYLRGLIKEESSHTSDNNLVTKKEFLYSTDISQKNKIKNYTTYSYYQPKRYDDEEYEQIRVVGTYDWISEPVFLDKVITHQGPYNQRSEIEYEYNKDYLVPTKTRETDCEGNVLETEVRYPFSYGVSLETPENPELYGLKLLRDNNILIPVETTVSRNGKILSGELTLFSYKISGGNNIFREVPVAAKKLSLVTDEPIPAADFKRSMKENNAISYDNRYEVVSENDYFNEYTDLISSRSLGGNNSSVIYGYNNSLVIAEVDNAVHSQPEWESSPVNKYLQNTSIPVKNHRLIIPFYQQVNFSFYYEQSTVNPIISYINIWIKNTAGIPLYKSENISPGGGSLQYTYFSRDLEQGEYYLDITAHDEMGADISFDKITFSLNITYGTYKISAPVRKNQVFHTSFEDIPTGYVNCPTAKTGIKAWHGTYSIDLQNFAPGDYMLSYWKSTDNGAKWEKISENLTITTAMKEKQIGGSYYLDEVRIHPVDARMTTYTYTPIIGKTSETDYNGRTVYWEYDHFGRVSHILDNDRNVLKSYEYHIKNQ